MDIYKGLVFSGKGENKFSKNEHNKVKLDRKEDDAYIYTTYKHEEAKINEDPNGNIICTKKESTYDIILEKLKSKRLGVMIVGIGGNNATTLLGGICANAKNISYLNRSELMKPNYLGSIFLSSNIRLGFNQEKGEHIYCPFYKVVDLYNPENIVFGGWDINDLNLKDCLIRNKVFENNLIDQISEYLNYVPLKSVYFKGNFISQNQYNRVNNILIGKNKLDVLEQIRHQIKNFKKVNNLDEIIVLWSGNTEKNIPHIENVNDTFVNLLHACYNNHPSISPSVIYALAAVLENCPYINGSPQNTLVGGIVELAMHKGIFIVGNDLKTGQTKIKNFLLDFYFGTGLKPKSIVSYNHLGNNDGKNLSSSLQFFSKKVSKSNLICDYVKANEELYTSDSKNIYVERTDNYTNVDSLNEVCENVQNENEVLDSDLIEKQKVNSEIVIKYVPYVGDDKKAIDEYISEIFMNGKNTIVLYNICQDSLLASPIFLDLILLVELSQRVYFKTNEKTNITEGNVKPSIQVGNYLITHDILKPKHNNYKNLNSVLYLSSIFCKSPFNSPLYKTRHSFFSQLESLTNYIRIISGLPIDAQIDIPYMI